MFVALAAGYFDEPFNWAAMKENADFIASFGGARDNLVPIDVQRRTAEALGAEWHEMPNRDHFFEPPFNELVECLDRNVKALAAAREGEASSS